MMVSGMGVLSRVMRRVMSRLAGKAGLLWVGGLEESFLACWRGWWPRFARALLVEVKDLLMGELGQPGVVGELRLGLS